MKFILSVTLACLSSGAFAQSIEMAPNTIKCEAFTKRPDGTWFVGASTTFDIGSLKNVALGNSAISPGSMNLGGTDLFAVIEQKCGGRKP